MLKNILSAVSIARKLLQARADYKNATVAEPQPAPAEGSDESSRIAAKIDILGEKLSHLEVLTREQASRIIELERAVKSTADATNDLARRASINFALGLSGLILGVAALAFVLLSRLS